MVADRWVEAHFSTFGPNLGPARTDVRYFARRALEQMEARRRPPLFLFGGPPGVGKTHIVREETANLQILWAMNRLEEFSKLDLLGNAEAVPLREINRRALLCENQVGKERIEQLEAIGLGKFSNRICGTCHRRRRCAYLRQFSARGDVSYVMTSAWMGTKRFSELAKSVDLLVFDEDPLDHAFEKQIVTKAGMDALDQVVQDMGAKADGLRSVVQGARHLLDGEVHRTRIRDRLLEHEVRDQISRIGNWDQLRDLEATATGDVGLESLPTMSPVDLAMAMKAAATGGPCRLVLSKQRRGDQVETVLELLRFCHVKVHKPIMVLDATANPILYRRLFPRHQIEEILLCGGLKAKRIQIFDQKLPKSTAQRQLEVPADDN